MEKMNLILKRCFYYIIGFISFSIIAFITQRIAFAIWLEGLIDPIQDLKNILSYISAYGYYYIIVYTLLYFVILYSISKYDKYIVNKINKKLTQIKSIENECTNGGDSNA